MAPATPRPHPLDQQYTHYAPSCLCWPPRDAPGLLIEAAGRQGKSRTDGWRTAAYRPSSVRWTPLRPSTLGALRSRWKVPFQLNFRKSSARHDSWRGLYSAHTPLR